MLQASGDRSDPWERFRREAAAWGVGLTEATVAAFQLYYTQLLEWNARMNLTRITDLESVIDKHFLDSLGCVRSGLFGPEADVEVVDMASGAGFPGIPLKMAFPGLGLTLIEATGKKAAFLEHIVAAQALKRAAVIQGRIEKLAHDPAIRERFDIAVARALGPLAVVAELGLPLVRTGGHLLAMKGPRGAGEVEQALPLLALLGGELEDTVQFQLPFSGAQRLLMVIRKVRTAPRRYPRPWSRIQAEQGPVEPEGE